MDSSDLQEKKQEPPRKETDAGRMMEDTPDSRNAESLMRVNFDPYSNATFSRDLHEEKHNLPRCSTLAGIRIVVNFENANADSRIRRNREPGANEIVSSDSHVENENRSNISTVGGSSKCIKPEEEKADSSICTNCDSDSKVKTLRVLQARKLDAQSLVTDNGIVTSADRPKNRQMQVF
jgi:hypothetical protein